MSFPSELRNLSTVELINLLDIYYVRDNQGRSFIEGDIFVFIDLWLKSDHPERIAFDNYNPLDLLIGYEKSENSREYFRYITGEDPQNFLNDTERKFYLTHGYGRPNKYISPRDYNLRIFYSNVSPTALVSLSDIFGICPTRQDPNIILDAMSDFNLKSIDHFHRDAVKKITDCLGEGSVCDTTYGNNLNDFSITGRIIPQQCDESKTLCFKRFLKSIGMLATFEYDPTHNVFISNLSQLNLYRMVIPDKVWNLEEVKDLPDIIVESIVRTLPDDQLNLIMGNDQNQLRSHLLTNTIKHLIQPRYDIEDNSITYGRFVDDSKKIMGFEDFIQSVIKHRALIDPFDNPFDVETAETLNQTLHSDVLRQIINKTKARTIENKDIVNILSNIDIDSLEGPVKKLNLWSKRDISGWFLVAINFDEYFQLWNPLFPDMIEDTFKYYKSILNFNLEKNPKN
jgi:hypothetical protein